MALNVWGLVGIIIFYALILIVGVWISKKKGKTQSEEEVMLAGRNIGLIVGCFTMTATWIGGGYINGTAEVMYTNGLVWCQAPFGYAISLVLAGLFFAKEMRKQGYITMLDPFQEKFGERMGGLLFFPALCGEVFWSAAILAALGATLSVIIGIGNDLAVIISTLIVVLYTLVGGLYSVSYTDVIQLFCIFFGLWLCIPFAITNEAVKPLDTHNVDWFGHLDVRLVGQYIDSCMLLICGGIPWQAYFQRVLSSKTIQRAQILSYVAAVGCLFMAVPPILIGMIGKATNWTATGYQNEEDLLKGKEYLVLPLVMQYLTPQAVSFFGLGAISAAVMSSADSAVLGSSSMFSRNIYKLIFRQQASEKEVVWVMRVSIILVGVLAANLAIAVHSIYGLWYISADLVYVILFPQLLCVIHFKNYCNTYGSFFAYFIGLLLRGLGGEQILSLPAVLKYPWYDEKDGQLFPFRTLAMLVSLITLFIVSWLTNWIFKKSFLPAKYDIFRCVVNIPDDVINVREPLEAGTSEELEANDRSLPSYKNKWMQVTSEVRKREKGNKIFLPARLDAKKKNATMLPALLAYPHPHAFLGLPNKVEPGE